MEFIQVNSSVFLHCFNNVSNLITNSFQASSYNVILVRECSQTTDDPENTRSNQTLKMHLSDGNFYQINKARSKKYVKNKV